MLNPHTPIKKVAHFIGATSVLLDTGELPEDVGVAYYIHTPLGIGTPVYAFIETFVERGALVTLQAPSQRSFQQLLAQLAGWVTQVDGRNITVQEPEGLFVN